MENNQPIQNHHESGSGTDKQRIWAMFCHLSSLIMLIGIPLGHIWGPLIIWLMKRKEMPLVDDAGRQSLNFQISMTLYTMISFILCFVFVGFLLIFPILLFNIVLVIYASIKVSNGEEFKYPFTIRFIK